jgi:hypothetical protein
MKIFFYAVLFFFISPLISYSQSIFQGYGQLFLPKKSYVVYKVDSPLLIDGKAAEKAWGKAKWTEAFVDIEGPAKPLPTYNTRVKMLWDNQYLYLYAEIEEPHVWAYYLQHDQIVYHENDFEVFIDPDCDGFNYFEFELNAANTLFDLFLPRPYRNKCTPLLSWDAQGFKSAVWVDGTINNPADVDKGWTIEMAIPFGSLKNEGNPPVPADGDTWKIDFSRVEWQTIVVDGKYRKKKDEKTGQFLNENNWVWSPTGEINMHVPERWGMLQFSNKRVGSTQVKFHEPENEELKKFLWLTYYKQYDFKKRHGQFAKNNEELSIPETVDYKLKIKLVVTGSGNDFKATVTTNDMKNLSINENGVIL